MGVVYLATDPSGRVAALKKLHDVYVDDDDFRARFAREVATLRRVSGRYVAPVIDADVDGDDPWLATEFIAGPNLARYVKEHGPFAPADWHLLATGLSAGLADVHAAGIVHRDLKPGNVILSAAGPRLIDFGIAHADDDGGLTRTGSLVGSPAWLAPEQINTGDTTPASDVFSLGSTLAFAATGRVPFGEGPTQVVMRRVMEDQPDLDGVTSHQVTILRRMMDLDPGKRPTARDAMLMLTGEASEPVSDDVSTTEWHRTRLVPAWTPHLASQDLQWEPPTHPVVEPPLAAPPLDQTQADDLDPTMSRGRRARGAVTAALLGVIAVSAAGVGFAVTSANGKASISPASSSPRPTYAASSPATTAGVSQASPGPIRATPPPKPTPKIAATKPNLNVYAGPSNLRITCDPGGVPYVADKTVMDADGDGYKDVVFGAYCSYSSGEGPLQMEAFLATPDGGSWDGVVLPQSEFFYFDQPCHPNGATISCLVLSTDGDPFEATFRRVNGSWRSDFTALAYTEAPVPAAPAPEPSYVPEPVPAYTPDPAPVPKPTVDPNDGVSGSIG